jgi:hypothetical protein
MLYNIDQGEAVDISSIPDEGIKASIKSLLKSLGLQKASKVRAGPFLLPPRATWACIMGLTLALAPSLSPLFAAHPCRASTA